LRQRAGGRQTREAGAGDLHPSSPHGDSILAAPLAAAMLHTASTCAREAFMARLRHIAVCVKDLDKAAAFYERVFDLKRLEREDLDIGSAIYMSDGVINLALLKFKGEKGHGLNDVG